PPLTPTTYPLSLHDALPISPADARPEPSRTRGWPGPGGGSSPAAAGPGSSGSRPSCAGSDPTGRRLATSSPSGADVGGEVAAGEDRKSTRLNSSHVKISYAV